MLGDKEKNDYADKGIETVNISLEAKPDYWEAIITKGLLYRVKAQVAPNARPASSTSTRRCSSRSRRWSPQGVPGGDRRGRWGRNPARGGGGAEATKS